MGFLSLFNKRRVVWRDGNGKIKCPGDSCRQKKCDDTCPVWCNTMGLTMYRMEHHDKAIADFKKAASLAPDFKDAWVNMADDLVITDSRLQRTESGEATK